jgi:hypothetical protein
LTPVNGAGGGGSTLFLQGLREGTAMRSERIFTCPAHTSVRRSRPGYCPQCGVYLEPDGSLMALVSNPVRLALSALALIAVTAAALLLAA